METWPEMPSRSQSELASKLISGFRSNDGFHASAARTNGVEWKTSLGFCDPV
jgi:hypothetical protein